MPDGPDRHDRDLYDRDFFAWTQDQAARLRALGSNAIDSENVAEEIESLGRSDRRSIVSFMRLIASHCLKIEFHPATAYVEHWREEITEFRSQLELVMEDSPSLRAHRDSLYATAWPQAVMSATSAFRKAGVNDAVARLPKRSSQPRYALDMELLDEDWFPTPSPSE